jgi:hypothetical protein
MREQEKRKLIGKTKEIEAEVLGESMYIRPYKQDEKMIAELARASSEKKSVVTQKLIRLALRGKQFDFTDEKAEFKKLDWLINNEKHKFIQADAFDARLERLEEHAQVMEKLQQSQAENSNYIRILISEIYCITNVCLSLLNQIFTRLIEYFSPVEIEKKNSTDFANRNVLGLVTHSLSELEKIVEHHQLGAETVEPEMLYIFTKIEKLKAKLLSSTIQSNSER